MNPTQPPQELKDQPKPAPSLDRSALIAAGLYYHDGGLSIIPVNAEKKPAIPGWKPYQKKQATREQVKRWELLYLLAGFAVVCGEVSGGLTIIDFDVPGFYEKWAALVGELAQTLPTQRTGGDGEQVAFRSGLVVANDKLAWAPADNTMGREFAIETRGEGGYAVLPPSFCHLAEKRGKRHQHPYQVIHGDFAKIPTITNEQARHLIEVARSLCQVPVSKKQMQAAPLSPRSNGGAGGNGVIGAFNGFYDVGTILSRNKYQPRGNRYLAPDSTTGEPGVYIFEDTGRCYSHHGNDPLNDGHAHNPFSVFCILEHGGDVKAAVKAAAAELGIERTHDRPQPPPADDGQDYDQAEREAIREEAQAKPPKATLYHAVIEAKDFIALNIPPRKVHLAPWLMEASINMICGPRGIGKTMLAFSIIESVARGAAFGPWAAGESANVLYLDGELTMADISERTAYFVQQNYLSKLYIYSDHYGNHLGLPSANLLDEDWRKAMKELLLDKNIKLWCVDNIASLAPGIDENSKKDWDPINKFFMELRFAGIGTAFVHHTGKEGQQRGTSGREDNIDISLMLDYPKNYSRENGCNFIAKFTKARIRHRDLHLIADTEFALLETAEGSHVWTFKNVKTGNKNAILEMIDQGMTQKDIAESLGLDKSYVSRIKSQAEKDGHIGANGRLTQSGYIYIHGA
jgi:hypothetical protein